MKARDVALIATQTALLIAVQFALSFVAGIELVTLFLAAFCFAFGYKKGIITAIAFSLLRCLLFGFFPTVIVLYLVYYPLYSAVLAFLGKLPYKNDALKLACVTAVCLVMTVCFTMLDNLIAPLIMDMKEKAWRAYFAASLPVMATHLVNVAATVGILFLPLLKITVNFKEDFFPDTRS